MTGKAQPRVSQIDRLNNADVSRREQLGMSRKTRSGNLSRMGSSPNTAPPQVAPSQTGLPILGGQMDGPIGFTRKIVQMIANTIDITSPASYSTYVTIGAGSVGTNLETISGTFDGQFLILMNSAGYDITIKEAVSLGWNIETLTHADINFASADTITLVYQQNIKTWFQITAGSTGIGGSGFINPAITNLNMNSFDINNVDSLRFIVDGQTLANSDYGIVARTTDLKFNIPSGKIYDFEVNGSPMFSIDSTLNTVFSTVTIAPLTDNTADLGKQTSSRWKNIFMGEVLKISEGISTTQYLTIQKEPSGHNAAFQLIDPINTSCSFNFYVNNTLNILTLDQTTLTLYHNLNTSWFTNWTIFKTGSTNFLIHNFVDITNTNIGYDHRINGVSYFQIVHNSTNLGTNGHNPINFNYSQVPIWISAGNQLSYIQYDGMATEPTTPPAGKSRLYMITSGGGSGTTDSLVIKWSDGTKSVIANRLFP